jgi:hypothetical protein
LLDFNKDGFVTLDDWNCNIKFDNNRMLKDFLIDLKKKNYPISKILNLLGVEGVRKVNVYSLKNGLLRLSSTLSEENAINLSKIITKGEN